MKLGIQCRHGQSALEIFNLFIYRSLVTISNQANSPRRRIPTLTGLLCHRSDLFTNLHKYRVVLVSEPRKLPVILVAPQGSIPAFTCAQPWKRFGTLKNMSESKKKLPSYRALTDYIAQIWDGLSFADSKYLILIAKGSKPLSCCY